MISPLQAYISRMQQLSEQLRKMVAGATMMYESLAKNWVPAAKHQDYVVRLCSLALFYKTQYMEFNGANIISAPQRLAIAEMLAMLVAIDRVSAKEIAEANIAGVLLDSFRWAMSASSEHKEPVEKREAARLIAQVLLAFAEAGGYFSEKGERWVKEHAKEHMKIKTDELALASDTHVVKYKFVDRLFQEEVVDDVSSAKIDELIATSLLHVKHRVIRLLRKGAMDNAKHPPAIPESDPLVYVPSYERCSMADQFDGVAQKRKWVGTTGAYLAAGVDVLHTHIASAKEMYDALVNHDVLASKRLASIEEIRDLARSYVADYIRADMTYSSYCSACHILSRFPVSAPDIPMSGAVSDEHAITITITDAASPAPVPLPSGIIAPPRLALAEILASLIRTGIVSKDEIAELHIADVLLSSFRWWIAVTDKMHAGSASSGKNDDEIDLADPPIPTEEKDDAVAYIIETLKEVVTTERCCSEENARWFRGYVAEMEMKRRSQLVSALVRDLADKLNQASRSAKKASAISRGSPSLSRRIRAIRQDRSSNGLIVRARRRKINEVLHQSWTKFWSQAKQWLSDAKTRNENGVRGTTKRERGKTETEGEGRG